MDDRYTIPALPVWEPPADLVRLYRNDTALNLVMQRLAQAKDIWQVMHILDSIRKDDYLRARIIAALAPPFADRPYDAFPYDSLR